MAKKKKSQDTTCKITITIKGKNCTDITVPGQPVPSQRVRHGKGGRFYMPKRTMDYRKQVAKEASKKFGKKDPTKGNVGLLSAFFREGNRDCDVDNLQKSIQDALIGIAYTDDTQVALVVAMKSTGAKEGLSEIKFLEIEEVTINAS